MKFITAFFMAWGNFITLPCPSRKWDNKLKNLMLAMLPSVGVVVGVLFTVLHALIQTYVLTMLTSYYYGEVSEIHPPKAKKGKGK